MKNQKFETVPEPPAAVQALECDDWRIGGADGWDDYLDELIAEASSKKHETKQGGVKPALIFLHHQQKEDP